MKEALIDRRLMLSDLLTSLVMLTLALQNLLLRQRLLGIRGYRNNRRNTQ